jgi:hypothetical protein
MVAFLVGTAGILVVSLALRIAVDELALRWASGALDIPRSLQGS